VGDPKYGGTSLGKLLQTITGSIIPQYLEQNKVAVVCSAISWASKSQGTTSLLLQAIDYAINSTRGLYGLNATIDEIKVNHLDASRALLFCVDNKLSCGDVFSELDDGIIQDCEDLRNFLLAAQVGTRPKSSSLIG
jgi:aspartate kinase